MCGYFGVFTYNSMFVCVCVCVCLHISKCVCICVYCVYLNVCVCVCICVLLDKNPRIFIEAKRGGNTLLNPGLRLYICYDFVCEERRTALLTLNTKHSKNSPNSA